MHEDNRPNRNKKQPVTIVVCMPLIGGEPSVAVVELKPDRTKPEAAADGLPD
jgi:hypothetical protein